MTHKQLLASLGRGEIAYWRASFILENEDYKQMRKEAEAKAAEAKVSHAQTTTLGTQTAQ
jgi:hypothetical protein